MCIYIYIYIHIYVYIYIYIYIYACRGTRVPAAHTIMRTTTDCDGLQQTAM